MAKRRDSVKILLAIEQVLAESGDRRDSEIRRGRGGPPRP